MNDTDARLRHPWLRINRVPRRPHVPELLEDRFLILWGDAHASVADRNLNESLAFVLG